MAENEEKVKYFGSGISSKVDCIVKYKIHPASLSTPEAAIFSKSNILAYKLTDPSFQPPQMHLTSMSTTKKAILAQKLSQKL